MEHYPQKWFNNGLAVNDLIWIFPFYFHLFPRLDTYYILFYSIHSDCLATSPESRVEGTNLHWILSHILRYGRWRYVPKGCIAIRQKKKKKRKETQRRQRFIFFPSTAQFELRSLCRVWLKKRNMADVATLDEEVKQEESTASVKSDTEETSEETPNGVKTWEKNCVTLLFSPPPLCRR